MRISGLIGKTIKTPAGEKIGHVFEFLGTGRPADGQPCAAEINFLIFGKKGWLQRVAGGATGVRKIPLDKIIKITEDSVIVRKEDTIS
jgi:hypothetical protein